MVRFDSVIITTILGLGLASLRIRNLQTTKKKEKKRKKKN